MREENFDNLGKCQNYQGYD